jgi:hypothetical protein
MFNYSIKKAPLFGAFWKNLQVIDEKSIRELKPVL